MGILAVMIRWLSLITIVAVSPGGAAQGVPVAWEHLGQTPQIVDFFTALAFLPGPAADGTLDTVFVSQSGGVYRYPPGGPLSENILNNGRSEAMAATRAGTLLAGRAPGWLNRSTDGGRTWANVSGSTHVILPSTLPALGGAVFAGAIGIVFRSTVDGEAGTWEEMGNVGNYSELAALGEIPPSPALPSGRLLVGTWNGAAYSDDGGETWPLSALWWPGRYVVTAFAFTAEPGHRYGGVAFASLRDFATGAPAVYRSGDGGASWELTRTFAPGEFGIPEAAWGTLMSGPDGALWLGLQDPLGGPTPGLGSILRSTDAGYSWEAVGTGFPGWGVQALAYGRDGRVYAGADRGLWRTTAPVTAGEVEPADAPTVLSVMPNPTHGEVVVTVTMREWGRLRLAAYDVLGREVCVLNDGPHAAGENDLPLDTSGWSPGVYVVRATARTWAAAARLVVR